MAAVAARSLIGGDGRAQPPTRIVLCLHGFRTNAHVLRLQTQDLFKHVGGDIVPVYIDAPHPARGPAYPAVEMAFPSAKEYGGWKEWYNYEPREGGGRECYEGMAESIEFVEREVARLQPFAICGFSQGAIIAALVAKNAEERCEHSNANQIDSEIPLCSSALNGVTAGSSARTTTTTTTRNDDTIQSKSHSVTTSHSASRSMARNPCFTHLLMLCAVPPRKFYDNYPEISTSPMNRYKTLHCIGVRDPMKGSSEVFASRAFDSASSDVLVHSGNHKPPSVFERGETFERIKTFLNQ